MVPGFGAQGPLVKPKSGDGECQSRGLFGLRRIPEELRQVRNEEKETRRSDPENSERERSHQRQAMAHRLSKVAERRFVDTRSFENEQERKNGIIYYHTLDSVHGKDHRHHSSRRGGERDFHGQACHDYDYDSKGFEDDKTVVEAYSVKEPDEYTSSSRPPVCRLLREPSVSGSHAGNVSSRKDSRSVPSSRRGSVSSRHREYDAGQQHRSSRVPSSAQDRSRGLGSRC